MYGFEKKIQTNIDTSIFLNKIYSKINDYNFSIKNLLASFNLDLFTGLKSLKILVNSIKKGNPLYIESIDKNIQNIIIGMFKTEKVSFESIQFRSKLLQIFHLSLNFPTYSILKNSIIRSKTTSNSFWEIDNIRLDHAIFSKCFMDKNTVHLNSSIIKNVTKNPGVNNLKKKLRLDHINFEFSLTRYDSSKAGSTKKGFKKKITFRTSPNLNLKHFCMSYKTADILMDKRTKNYVIVLSEFEKKIQVLSHKNEKFTLDLKEVKKKFIKLSFSTIKGSTGRDKNGKKLIPGNHCQILNGNFKQMEASILFYTNETFFVKFSSKLTNNGYLSAIERSSVSAMPEIDKNIRVSTKSEPVFISIISGQFKGYKCKVLKIEESFLEVLILSISKIIKISRVNVKFY